MEQQVIIQQLSTGALPYMQRVDNCNEWLRTYLAGANKVLVVCGRVSYTACGAEKVIEQLQSVSDAEYKFFYDFSANPKEEEVIKGEELCKQFHPDSIIAIGGGSVMDMAKLIRHYAKISVPLIAIPTTAGTGAESTQFAVCYINGAKQSIESSEMLPNVAILMPELTMSGNKHLTVTCAFDAFAQAIEAYWNRSATDESDAFAKEAIVMLFLGLTQFVESHGSCIEECIWREMMMGGANMAGQAINLTRTTAPHAMSYILTSKYGYAHGHAVALTFPYFAKLNILCPRDQYTGINYETYHEKMVWLANCLGLEEQRDMEVALRKFINTLGLRYKEETNVDVVLVARSINLERAGNNPHKLTEEIISHAAESIIKK